MRCAAQVVSELELQSRSVALQAGSLSSERQALSALEAQRRGALREMEAGLQVRSGSQGCKVFRFYGFMVLWFYGSGVSRCHNAPQ